MEQFIKHKLPATVKYAFIDADPIAYAGSFGVQKARYKYVNSVTGEETLLFDNAKQGKLRMAHEEEKCELFGFEFKPDEWVREKVVTIGTEEEAFKATGEALKGYTKHVKGCEWQGFLTEKGAHKNKDIPGLPKRYQGNRDGLATPVHLLACRKHLHDMPEVSMVKGGFEADSVVIARAEKKGKEGVLLSLDKDLRQAENTYVIDMSYDPPMILIADGNVGGVWQCPLKSNLAKKQYKYTGVGFKWLCYQAVAGDQADHYGGIKGCGSKTVIEALDGCETYHQCLDAVYALYEAHGRFKYTSWDGQEMDLSPAEAMLQHFNLAYQERTKSDSFNFEKYGWKPNGKDC